MPFELVEDTPGPLNPADGGPPDLPLGLQPKESTIPLKNRLITGGAIGASMLAPELIAPVMAGSRLLGPLLARPALNTAAQAAIGGTESALKGQDPTWGATAAGGLQGLMEVLSNIPRIGKMVKAGSAAQKAYTEAEALRKAATEAENVAKQTAFETKAGGEQARYESQKSIVEGANKQAETGFQQATKDWAERQAAGLAEAYKSKVPAWGDYPSTTEGLYKMVKGDGPQRASKAFDETMQSIGEMAKGAPPIQIRLKDAKKLDVPILGKVDTTGPVPTAAVDPGELAKKAVGFWKKDRGVYNRVMEQLDAAGLGDPAARGAYKSAMTLIESVDQARLLEGGQFHPERIIPAMEKKNKYLDISRKRGEGDIFTGPLQAAGRGAPTPPIPQEGPLAPVALEPPTATPFTKGPSVSPDVTMLNKPYHLPSLLGLGGGALGYSMGSGGHLVGSGLGMLTGMGAGMLMPTHVPMGNLPPDFLSAAGMDLPTLIQTYLRQQMGQ